MALTLIKAALCSSVNSFFPVFDVVVAVALVAVDDDVFVLVVALILDTGSL